MVSYNGQIGNGRVGRSNVCCSRCIIWDVIAKDKLKVMQNYWLNACMIEEPEKLVYRGENLIYMISKINNNL